MSLWVIVFLFSQSFTISQVNLKPFFIVIFCVCSLKKSNNNNPEFKQNRSTLKITININTKLKPHK